MQQMSSGGEAVKQQVVDKIPKRFKELKFGIQYDTRPSLCLRSDAYCCAGQIRISSTNLSSKSRIACSTMSKRIAVRSSMVLLMLEWFENPNIQIACNG